MFGFDMNNPLPFLIGAAFIIIVLIGVYAWVSVVTDDRSYQQGWWDGYEQALNDSRDERDFDAAMLRIYAQRLEVK